MNEKMKSISTGIRDMISNESRSNVMRYIYYVVVLGIFVILKLLYRDFTSEDLGSFLLPTSKIVSIFTGHEFLVEAGTLVFPAITIVIDKSCCGFNFFAICGAMLCVLSSRYLTTLFQYIISLPVFFLLAYLLTILANSSRIIFSITSQGKFESSSVFHSQLAHQIQGSFVYLFFLISAYLLTEYIFRKHYQSNEKIS